MRFTKYHALGNDYLVLDPADAPELPGPDTIRRICHRNFGLGSDGILYGPLPSSSAEFGLRILNPDGSEAEKSGNGLRIFARYLLDTGRVDARPFNVHTAGGTVECRVDGGGDSITVEMGKVSFDAADIPVRGFTGEVLQKEIDLGEDTLRVCAATIGNPHCIVPMDRISATEAKRLGPRLEKHHAFPNRTNVQLLQVVDRRNIKIEIWERGAGYTLASGSSSSATGAVARRLGWVDPDLTVHMPGGQIQLHIDDDFAVRMTGPATRVAEMIADPSFLQGDS